MITFLHKIGVAIAAGLTGLAALFSPVTNIAPVGATIPVSVAVFQTSLATGITASDTSMTLVTGTDKSGDALSGYTCFNVDEGTASEEFMCGTAAGTAISSLVRGIDPVDGDLEVTALKKVHRRSASVKITDYPSIGIIGRILNGDETLPNILTYDSAPSFSAGSNELATIKYADDLAIAGSPNASTSTKGIAEEATEAEIDAGTAAGTAARLFVNPSTLATSIYGTQLPSSGEKSALVGNNTDIAVGSGNKYVTQTGFQHNAEKYAADAEATDTYVITLSPVPTSYTNGMVVHFKANTANTGAATINVNSLGAKTIVKYVSTALADGDIAAGMLVTLIYDGTNFVLQNPIANVVSVLTPAWELVETKTITAVALTSGTLTKIAEWTSLTGDTTDEYMIVYEVACSNDSNSSLLALRFNDASTGAYNQINTYLNNTTPTAVKANGDYIYLAVGSSTNNASAVAGSVIIKGSKTIAGTIRQANGSSTYSSVAGGTNGMTSGGGSWTDTSTQLTSLQLYYNQGSGGPLTISGKASLYKINR